MARDRVVVIGAGFGGLSCVRRLRGEPVEVLLLDRHNYHLFTPLLYQVASALLNPSEVAIPVRSILDSRNDVRFRMTEVTGVDLESGRVLTEDGPIPYDWLVVAAGSRTAYYGKHGVRAGSYGVKVLPDALALRNRILGRLEEASTEEDPAARRRALTFVVVGGGPTGVEYAGALVELFRLVVGNDFPDLDPAEPRVILIEMSDGLLSEFPEKLGRYARARLEDLGVDVRTGAAVDEYRDGRVLLGGRDPIEADTLIWAAGVRPTGLAQAAAFPRAESGRIEVDEHLRVRGCERVFAVGDIAQLEEAGRPLPMMAPPAMQAGKQAAGNILRAIRGQPMEPFRYRDKGIMAVIGRNAGVARIGKLELKGFIGWIGWLFVHLYYLIGFRNRLTVLIRWAWYYLLYDRPIRIIARARSRADATPLPPDDE
ncbi:MAG: NAD(P)/FAD-dependent oxidoreductase [Gemmatimonadota bacterium]